MVCVKKGSIERLREVKLGDRGFSICDSECKVGGCGN